MSRRRTFSPTRWTSGTRSAECMSSGADSHPRSPPSPTDSRPPWTHRFSRSESAQHRRFGLVCSFPHVWQLLVQNRSTSSGCLADRLAVLFLCLRPVLVWGRSKSWLRGSCIRRPFWGRFGRPSLTERFSRFLVSRVNILARPVRVLCTSPCSQVGGRFNVLFPQV